MNKIRLCPLPSVCIPKLEMAAASVDLHILPRLTRRIEGLTANQDPNISYLA